MATFSKFQVPGTIQDEGQSVNTDLASFAIPQGTIQNNVAPEPPRQTSTIAAPRMPEMLVEPGTKPGSGPTPQPSRPEAAKTEQMFDSQDIQAGLGAAAGAISDQATAQANVAQSKYSQQISEWKRNGQFWMDPNADVAPDIEGYLQAMPSSKDALLEGQLLQDIHGDNAWLGAFLDPTTSIITAAAYGDNENAQEMASYVSGEGVTGAIEGYGSTGNWAGAVVGAVIGVITGLTNWYGAEDEDKANAEKARKEYERMLKAWQLRQNFRAQSAKRAGEVYRGQAEKALYDKKKAEKKAEQQEAEAHATTRRRQFVELMDYMDRYDNAYRNFRQQRWA